MSQEERAAGCPCGNTHTGDEVFFVSAKRGSDYAPILGPYTSHGEALALVEKGRELAELADPRAVFYAFGTFSALADTKLVGQLNGALADDAAAAGKPTRAKRIAHYRHKAG